MAFVLAEAQQQKAQLFFKKRNVLISKETGTNFR